MIWFAMYFMLIFFIDFEMLTYFTLSLMSLKYFSTYTNIFTSQIHSYFQLNEHFGMVIFMMIIVLYLSNLFKSKFESKMMQMIFYLLMMTSFYMFITNNFLLMFVMFELSLLPISYIILKWGIYLERSKGVILMMMYTLLFSVPFLISMLWFFKMNCSWNLSLLENFNLVKYNFMSAQLMLLFSVKLPVVGIHFWLPVAHVEAPTFGSMILAGILLKLGGMGLLKIKMMLNLMMIKNMMGYMLYGYILSLILCFMQNDFKKLIAYSSIFHMSLLPMLLCVDNEISFVSFIIIMVLHGVISPLLFLTVGVIYSLLETRKLILIRGIFMIYPNLALMASLGFISTLPAPPFMSFMGEILSIFSLGMWNLMLLILGFGIFMSLIYNLNWLIPMFNNSNISVKQSPILFSYNYIYFICYLVTIFLVLWY